MRCVGKFCPSHCFLCILLGSPIHTLGDFILPGENYDEFAIHNVCTEPQLTAGFSVKLPDRWDVAYTTSTDIENKYVPVAALNNRVSLRALFSQSYEFTVSPGILCNKL